MARGHADGLTRTPVRGATWQVRMARGGPTGIVGSGNSGGGGGGGNAIGNRGELPYLIKFYPVIFSVWDIVPHVLPFAGDVDASYTLDFLAKHRSRGPESTRSSIQARA